MNSVLEQYRERFIGLYAQRLRHCGQEFLNNPNQREQALDLLDTDWHTILAAWKMAVHGWPSSTASQKMVIDWAVESLGLLERRLSHTEIRDWLSNSLKASLEFGSDSDRSLYHTLLGREENVYGSMEAAAFHYAAAEIIDGTAVRPLKSTERFANVALNFNSPKLMLETIDRLASQPRTAYSDLLYIGLADLLPCPARVRFFGSSPDPPAVGHTIPGVKSSSTAAALGENGPIQCRTQQKKQ